jgi:hypothetical protein
MVLAVAVCFTRRRSQVRVLSRPPLEWLYANCGGNPDPNHTVYAPNA